MLKQTNDKKLQQSETHTKGRNVTVSEEQTLLPFLFDLLKEQSKSSVKSLLSHGQISVNGTVTRQFDTPLSIGDNVFISYLKGKVEFKNPLLKIVWEDDDLIVVNKKEGLLSVSSSRVKERTAYHFLSEYVKKIDPHNKIFILHRLDRDTSGLMMFAKNQETQKLLQNNWSRFVTERTYVAVVEGVPEKKSGLLITNLVENKQLQVYVTQDGGGKEAITRYQVLRDNGNYALVQLHLETGRKNQIRAQMQSIGHSIAGDYKYGAETDPVGRLMLHARKLFFIHPRTGKEMQFETRIPDKFYSLTNHM